MHRISLSDTVGYSPSLLAEQHFDGPFDPICSRRGTVIDFPGADMATVKWEDGQTTTDAVEDLELAARLAPAFAE